MDDALSVISIGWLRSEGYFVTATSTLRAETAIFMRPLHQSSLIERDAKVASRWLKDDPT